MQLPAIPASPSRPDKEMPGVRAEGGTDAPDEEEGVVGQAAPPSDGGGDSDKAVLREALDTEGEEPSSSTHSPYVQVGEKKVRGAFLSQARYQIFV